MFRRTRDSITAGAGREAGDGLVFAAVLDGQGGARLLKDWSAVRRWKPADGPLWVHLNREHETAQGWLWNEAGLDRHVAQSLAVRGTRPRAHPHGEGTLIVLRGINFNEGADPEDMVAVRCWLDADRLITTRTRSFRATRELRTDLMAGNGPASLAQTFLSIAGRLDDQVAPMIEALEKACDEMEEAVMETADTKMRRHLATMRAQAIELRRHLAPQRDAFRALSADMPAPFGESDQRHLRRHADEAERYVEDLDMIRERAAVIQDEIFNQLSVQQGRSTLALSVVATIMLPLTFVTGLLGVNIGGMHEGVFGGAWFLLLGALGGLSLFTLAMLKIARVI